MSHVDAEEHSNRQSTFLYTVGALVGISVPSLFFGRTAIALAVGLAVLFAFLVRHRRDYWHSVRSEVNRPLGISVAVTMGFWLPNIIASADSFRSFEAVSRTGVFVLIGVFLWSILERDRNVFDYSRRAFVATSVVAVVLAIFSLTIFPQFYWFTHLHGWRSDPIDSELKFFAALSVLAIPILLAALMRMPGIWKWMALLSISGFLLIVAITDNRAAVAGILAAVIASMMAIAFRSKNKRQIIGLASILVAVSLATVTWLYFERSHVQDYVMETLPDKEWIFPVWLIDFERQLIWTHTFRQALEAPVFGIGANMINFTPGADRVIPGTTGLHLIPSHPHNWVIEVFAETGLLGLLPMVATIFLLFRKLFLDFIRTGQNRYLVAIAISAGYWGSGLFNFSFWSAWWQVSFVLSLAICLSEIAESRSDGENAGHSRPLG